MVTLSIGKAHFTVGAHSDQEGQGFVTNFYRFMASAQAAFGEFWEKVYGEKRINLPAIPELMAVLWEMGAFPSLEMLEPSPIRVVPTRQGALALLRKILFIRTGNANDAVLEDCFDQLTEKRPDGYALKNAAPRREGWIQWRTGD